jgi:hypothetical protein
MISSFFPWPRGFSSCLASHWLDYVSYDSYFGNKVNNKIIISKKIQYPALL